MNRRSFISVLVAAPVAASASGQHVAKEDRSSVDFYREGVRMGFLTVNEVRALDGLRPL